MLSEHFLIQEFIPIEIFLQYGNNSQWFIDPRIVNICEWIRVKTGHAVTINNWHTGGQYNYSGFRPPLCKIGATLSQHRFGRAVDIKIAGLTVEEVFALIKRNFIELNKLGLTTVENIAATLTWNHLDTRYTGMNELLIVNP